MNDGNVTHLDERKSSIIVDVNANDVLCGRGGLSNRHPGNRLFRRLVDHNKQNHQNSISSSYKHFMAVSIITAIERKGGRFLRKENKSWVRVLPKVAHRKTAQALREQDCPSSSSPTAATYYYTSSDGRIEKRPGNIQEPLQSTDEIERSEIYATMKQSWQSEEAASRHSSPGKPIANTDEINLERAISLHHNEGYSQLQQLQPAITSFAQKCFPSSAHHEGEARIEEALLPGFVHHASSDEQDSPDEEIECHPHPLQETDWTAYC
jgi:hypothetical protein